MSGDGEYEAGDAQDEAGPEERTRLWFENRSSVRFRAASGLSRWSGGLIRSPGFRSTERFYRDRDTEENQECRPAPGQRVETWILWATEAYTPAYVHRLLASLETFKPVQRGLSDRDPAEWVRKQRGNPGSRFHLYLRRRGSGSISMGFETDLPPFARAVQGTIWSVTPSLTMLTMAFLLSDAERERFEGVLRADHPTRLERLGGTAIGIHSPELERRRLIAEARADWRRQAGDWFARNVPGLLAETPGGLATCELTVVEGLSPFPSRMGREPLDMRDSRILTALEMHHATVFVPAAEEVAEEGEDDAEVEVREEGLFFAPSPTRDHGLARHSIMAVTKAAFHRQDARGWGDGESRFAHRFEETFRSIPAQWAVTSVLNHFRDRVLSSRDALARIVGGTSVGAALGRARRDTAECADAATVARDVRRGVADHSLALYHSGLTLRRRRGSDEPKRLDGLIREVLEEAAENLGQDVADLNGTLHAQAALLSAHANLKLQPWIVLLAIVSAIAGIVAAVAPTRDLIGSTARSEIHARPHAVEPLAPRAAQIR